MVWCGVVRHSRRARSSEVREVTADPGLNAGVKPVGMTVAWQLAPCRSCSDVTRNRVALATANAGSCDDNVIFNFRWATRLGYYVVVYLGI